MTSYTRPQSASSVAEEPDRTLFGFRCLVFFTFIVFVAPQQIYGFLEPLRLAKVSMLLAMAAYVQNRSSCGLPLYPVGTEYRLLTVFTACILLSIPTSVWPGGSLSVVIDLYLKSLIVCVLTAQLLNSTEKVKRMLWWILGFCVIVSLAGLKGYQQGDVIAGYRMRGTSAGISANPNDFALTLNLFIPYALIFFLMTKRLMTKVFLGGFLLIAVASILLTFSRGGFVTLVAVLGLTTWKAVRQGRVAQILVPALIGVGTLVLLAPEGYGDRIASILDSSQDASGSSDARYAAIMAALELVAEQPLTGVGVGMNIIALVDKGFFWDHVHNVYLEIASEIGIPGLVVYVMLLFKLIMGLRQTQSLLEGVDRSEDLRLLAQATEVSLLSFAIAAFLHPVAYHFYFYYLCGFGLAIKQIAQQVREDQHAVAGQAAETTLGLKRRVGMLPGL